MAGTHLHPIETAVVLCAGRGNRLGELTSALPKTMLEIRGGLTILDRALATLAAVGIRRARIVAGYFGDVLTRDVARMERAHGVPLVIVENAHHDSRNNAFSLALGLLGVDEDLFVVNGDTLFTPEAVRRLGGAPAAPVTLAVDRVKRLGDEEMKVRFDRDGSLEAISKQLDPAAADGEYIGLARVAGSAVPGLRGALDDVWSRDPALYYEDGFGGLAASGVSVTMVDVGDLPWIEVDTPEDLERARMMSWPS